MSGFEIVGLIGEVKTCIEAYQALSTLIRNIREMGHDVANLENRILEADTRLYAFSRIHNLTIQGNEQRNSLLPPYWLHTVLSYMAQIKGHLDIAQNVMKKYMKLPNGDPRLAAHIDPIIFDLNSRPIDSVAVDQALAENESRSRELQNSGIRKKVVWLMKDRRKLSQAVEGLERANDSLSSLTAPQLGTLIYDAVASRQSSDELSRRRFREERGEEQGERRMNEVRLAEVAVAHQYALALENENFDQKVQRRLEISSLPEVMTGDPPDQRSRQQTALQPENQSVLIEWKEYDSDHISREEVVTRFSDISAILNSPPTYIDNILSSPGFVEDDRSNDRGTSWIGIVYRSPSFVTCHDAKTLRDHLSRPGRSSEQQQRRWKPPLGDRFKLALVLAKSLLSIHNCGWYHKGLRPENVVFFSSAKPIAKPYLLGWDYARPARPGQKTETVISSWKDGELYQHPDWFTSHRSDTSRFRQAFDQYQLGCLLLEIGSWELLSDIKRSSGQNFAGEQWRQSWRQYLLGRARKLDFKAGEIYSEVVITLLQGLDQDMEFWDTVVLRLSQCIA